MKRFIWILPLLALAACGPADKSAENPAAATGESGATAPMTGTLAADDPAAASALQTATASAGPTQTADPTVQALAQSFKLPQKGKADPIVVIFEFSDYACPFCKEFADTTAKQVDKDYVQTGKVGVMYWDFPLPNHGYPALIGAESAHCAGEQGKYWEMHDALFERQGDLLDANTKEGDAAIEKAARETVIKMGTDLKLDEAKMRECVESKKYEPIILSLVKEATDKGINQTPTFVISSKDHSEPIIGSMEYKEFKVILDREISRALGTPIPETPTPLATAADAVPDAGAATPGAGAGKSDDAPKPTTTVKP